MSSPKNGVEIRGCGALLLLGALIVGGAVVLGVAVRLFMWIVGN